MNSEVSGRITEAFGECFLNVGYHEEYWQARTSFLYNGGKTSELLAEVDMIDSTFRSPSRDFAVRHRHSALDLGDERFFRGESGPNVLL